MKPTFEATDDGVEIIDRIERRRYRLTTHETVTPTPVDNQSIRFPVDAAVRLTTDRITLPTTNLVLVRDGDGSMVSEVRPTEQTILPHDEYVLDISGPLKVYARIESSLYVYSDDGQTQLSLDADTDVVLGARSYHERPAGTITTTAEPTDVMKAVSAFGSALKTSSPERSYPTLRGHPPRLERGDELDIPDQFSRPETGVRIEVPPTLRHVYVVTPLAYYLGADIVSGSEPRLCTETGYSYSLDGEGGFEATIERVLKHVFLLDCIVRTEGITPLHLHERDVVEPILDFDVPAMYDRSLAEQLETYLEIPLSELEPHHPEWRLEVRVEATEETVEFLPFLAAELAAVRTADQVSAPSSAVAPRATVEAVESFTRNDFTRSASSGSSPSSSSNPGSGSSPTRGSDIPDDGVETAPQSVPTVQQSWDSIRGSNIRSTTPVSAYYNGLGRTPREDAIEIAVVCNDEEMRNELESVSDIYGTNEEHPFDVTVHWNVETDELERLLQEEHDFFHYIGHIERNGFQCPDGKLDSSQIDEIGTKAFLLNGCKSHDQGLQLIEAGGMGGIVTLDDVVNSGAVKMGSTIAQLLNYGLPLYGALDIAHIENAVAQQYLIVGNGRTTVAQSGISVPNICIVKPGNETTVTESLVYSDVRAENGGIFRPHVDSINSYYLMPGRTNCIPMEREELKAFFTQEQFPVLIGDEIHWSNNIDVNNI